MRTLPSIVACAALMWLVGCDGSINDGRCEAAAQHLAQCTGAELSAPATCDVSAAETVLGLSCSELTGRAGLSNNPKQCPAGMVCVPRWFLFWKDECSFCMDSEPRATGLTFGDATSECQAAGAYLCGDRVLAAAYAGIKVYDRNAGLRTEWSIFANPVGPKECAELNIFEALQGNVAANLGYPVDCDRRDSYNAFRCCADPS